MEENLKDWTIIFVGIFGGIVVIVLMLAWMLWLMRIFIFPQFSF